METKKSKVTKITKWDKKEGYKETSYTIEFANNDSGYYSSIDDDQKRFVVNQEAEYCIESKEGKNGKKYNKITSNADPKQAWAGKSGGGRPQVEPRIQMISFAAAYTKDLIVAGKIGIQQFETEFNRIYNVMTARI